MEKQYNAMNKTIQNLSLFLAVCQGVSFSCSVCRHRDNLSPYPDHLLPHRSKLQTVLFNIHHPTFGINSLTLSVSLIHILVFRLLTTLHKSDPHCHHHLCHHQSLLLFFTLDLKHTSSSSLFHHRLLHRYSLD